MRLAVLLLVPVTAAMAGCGGGATASSVGTGSEQVLAGPVEAHLLRLDEILIPGFAVQSAPAPVTASALVGGDAVRLDTLRVAGFVEAASVRFFRSVPTLAGSNGPLDVISTAERFGGAAGAHTALAAEIAGQDSAPGATALSTGPLGDEAHGDLVTADDQGVTIAQTTLVWRRLNVLCVLVVRERLGGSPLAHALAVARPVAARLGGAVPAPQ